MQDVHQWLSGPRPLDLVPFWKPPNSTEIQTAARQSPLLTEAQKNTVGMLDGMLTSLGFQRVTVTFAGTPAG